MRLATLAILLTVILSGDAFGQVFRRRPAQGQQPVQPAAETPPQQSAPEPVAEAPKAEAPKAEAPKAEAPKAEAPKAEAPKAEAPKAEAPKVPVDKPKDGRLEPSPTPVIRRTNKRVVAPGLGD
jgi:hypothetical protein